MLIAGLTAKVLGTNCYVVAAQASGPCIVVDPGFLVGRPLADLLEKHGLHPEAVLLTHGHVDHTAGAAKISDRWNVPVYVHPQDRGQLVDPASGIFEDLRSLFGEGFMWRQPGDVLPYPSSGELSVAGLDVRIDHAPGHTPGCVLLRPRPVTPASDEQIEPVCLTGDVLFAGAIGRTDLPGGSPAAMVATLRDKILSLADETVVLPGHGPRTTMASQRATNVYLRAVTSGQC